MTFIEKLYINTFDENCLPLAQEQGLGLEMDFYLWDIPAENRTAIDKKARRILAPFRRHVFHGTAVSRDLESIWALPNEELLHRYDASWQIASSHGIRKIVFHSDYTPHVKDVDDWLIRRTDLWQTFLADKPRDMTICLENVIDDTPEPMLRLRERVGDSRFLFCLDTGHAHANAHTPVTQWIEALAPWLNHAHLHNNDGYNDQHRPVGDGTLDMKEALETFFSRTKTESYTLECALAESLAWLREQGFIA